VPVVPATSTNRSATSTPAASLTTRSIPTAVPRRTPSTTNCSTAYPRRRIPRPDLLAKLEEGSRVDLLRRQIPDLNAAVCSDELLPLPIQSWRTDQRGSLGESFDRLA